MAERRGKASATAQGYLGVIGDGRLVPSNCVDVAAVASGDKKVASSPIALISGAGKLTVVFFLHPELGQSLQVTKLQRQRVFHHRVGGFAERGKPEVVGRGCAQCPAHRGMGEQNHDSSHQRMALPGCGVTSVFRYFPHPPRAAVHGMPPAVQADTRTGRLEQMIEDDPRLG